MDLTINYNAEPVPQLRKEDRLWLDSLLKQHRLR
ncbi:MAG: hypothetical protein F6K31_05125 [Symploca sp. SIO2G7]|nr:hypothetical protein [Symploca sp. SIO2G7]